MYTVKTIQFSNKREARVLETLPTVSANDCIRYLQIPNYRFSIVLHVGALEMDPQTQKDMTLLLRESLVRFAEDNRALVADGATDTGFVKIMGAAYESGRATFPLVGVTVRHQMLYPDEPEQSDRWYLNDSHTHFVILDGDDFGLESQVLVGLARSSGNYGISIVINGGQITRAEIEMQAALGTPVIVMKGTGRYADALADAEPGSELRLPFEQNATMLEIFDVNRHTPEVLYHMIRRLLLR